MTPAPLAQLARQVRRVTPGRPEKQVQQGRLARRGLQGPANYFVQALTSSPADGKTYYFGQLPKALVTTANISRVYFRSVGTIRRAGIYTYSGTAGTGENISMYIRKNNTTDYLIGTLGSATNARAFSNTSLDIPMSIGDYVEIKMVCPTWATNPLTFIAAGYLTAE